MNVPLGWSQVIKISNFSGANLLKVANWLKNEIGKVSAQLDNGNPCLKEVQVLKKMQFFAKIFSFSFIK